MEYGFTAEVEDILNEHKDLQEYTPEDKAAEIKQKQTVPLPADLQEKVKNITNPVKTDSFLSKNKRVASASIIGAVGGLIFGYVTKRNLLLSAMIGGVAVGFIANLKKA